MSLRDILPSADRLQMVYGVLFTASLMIGTTLWDDAGVSHIGRAGIAVSVGLCLLFVSLCRHRRPLLLCAAFLVSVRLAFALGESTPDGNILFAADCFAVCLSISVIAFRKEIAELSQRQRIHAKPSLQVTLVAD